MECRPFFAAVARTGYERRMPDEEEHQPGDRAPATAHYEELNVFGTPTGAVVHVREGDQKKTPREFWEPSRGEVVNMGKLSCRNASDTFALSQKLAAVISRKKPRDGCGGQGGASMAGVPLPAAGL